MMLCCSLMFVMALVLSVTPLRAQEPLPASTRQSRATLIRLDNSSGADLREMVSRSQSGDPEAQYLLALMYEEGRLVPRNLATARGWMLTSAEQGYTSAEDGIGEMYLGNMRNDVAPDYPNADRWLRLAAQDGNAEAQFWLGTGYERGWFGVDYSEAINWLKKAAAQGLPDAQFRLGQMYEAGEGVPESDEMAARWYRKAADHFPMTEGVRVGGVWEAEGQLCQMYDDGRLKQDYMQAYMWFAVVSSSLDPPTDVGMERAALHMTTAQIAQAQRMAEDWVKRHTPPGGLGLPQARKTAK